MRETEFRKEMSSHGTPKKYHIQEKNSISEVPFYCFSRRTFLFLLTELGEPVFVSFSRFIHYRPYIFGQLIQFSRKILWYLKVIIEERLFSINSLHRATTEILICQLSKRVSSLLGFLICWSKNWDIRRLLNEILNYFIL